MKAPKKSLGIEKQIEQKLSKIIYDYLGMSASNLFTQFFSGFPVDEQISGAHSIVSSILGKTKADELFQDLENIITNQEKASGKSE